MKLIDVISENIELNKIDIHIVVEGYQEALRYAETLDKLKGEEIDLDAKKHREKRSLNANNYFYQLVGKIADKLDASKDEIHNRMLARYGQYMKDGDKIVFCLYPADIDYKNQSEVHLKPTGHFETRKGVQYEWFAVMRGSHTYDTQEMAKLIDGVVSECRDLDISVLTPDEIKRMVGNYGQPQNVHKNSN